MRAKIEAGLAAVFLVLTVVTVVWPRWIESSTGLEPDGGSGGAEWGLVAFFGIAALCFALAARRHWVAIKAA